MTYALQHDAEGAPVLVTERLVLRKPRPGDLPACIRFWASDRSRIMGGPWTPDETATDFADVVAQWDWRGFGLFSVTLAGDAAMQGLIGTWHPKNYPEPEIGWSLYDPALEGRGLAFEAARAALDWFFAATGQTTAVSHTDPQNRRSHRLCERLGAVIDPEAAQPADESPTLTWRHHAPGVPA